MKGKIRIGVGQGFKEIKIRINMYEEELKRLNLFGGRITNLRGYL